MGIGNFLAFAACLITAIAAPKMFVPQLNGRIIGGHNVTIEDYPYQVSLLYGGIHSCGGFIISPEFVVTAAHCTASSKLKFSIRAGSSILNSGGVVRNVSIIYQHPKFDGFDYDVSVLRLEAPLNYTKGINATPLPPFGQDIPINSTGFVTGWGTTDNGTIANILQGVSVLTISQESCKGAYTNRSITDRMFCAGCPQGKRDSCQGDSGGPLTVKNITIGIVSWGSGCGDPKYPGVYANIAALRDYIKCVSGI